MDEQEQRPDDGASKLAPVQQDGGRGDYAASLQGIAELMERIAGDMQKAQLAEYINLMNRPLQLIWRNFLSGLTRGIGIALGFTFFAATIVWVLQLLGKLNLPVVGDYIADIVRIVQRQLQINPY